MTGGHTTQVVRLRVERGQEDQMANDHKLVLRHVTCSYVDITEQNVFTDVYLVTACNNPLDYLSDTSAFPLSICTCLLSIEQRNWPSLRKHFFSVSSKNSALNSCFQRFYAQECCFLSSDASLTTHAPSQSLTAVQWGRTRRYIRNSRIEQSAGRTAAFTSVASVKVSTVQKQIFSD